MHLIISLTCIHGVWGQVNIFLETNPEQEDYGAILVSGLDQEAIELFEGVEDWKDYFQVRVVGLEEGLPPMLGSSYVQEIRLIFRPRFPVIEGRLDEVIFNYTTSVRQQIVVPKLSNPKPAGITQIYPTTEFFPENQLKIYLHFSAPMRYGEALKYVKLYDEQGEAITAPFLDMGQELWNKEYTRLTLWFDPGRIKRHLQPNLKSGPPLQQGKAYTLVVHKEWKDANGLPMAQDKVKAIQIIAADTEQPRPENWQISYPEPGTNSSLEIDFLEPMDHALLENGLLVLNQQDEVVKGAFSIAKEESFWSFRPMENWKPGRYRIRINTRLEDLAGNNLRRLFDRDVEDPENENLDKVFIDLEFLLL